MAGFIETGVLFLYDLGFFTTVLPFFLFYVILFGLFERTNIFGNSEYHAMLSFCFSFLTIYNVGVVENITLLIARVGLLFLIIMTLIIITGLLGVNGVFATGLTVLVIALYLGYVILEIFVGSNLVDIINQYVPVDALFPVLVAGAVFGGIIWFVFRGTSSSGSSGSNSGKSVNKDGGSKKPRSDAEESSSDSRESSPAVSNSRVPFDRPVNQDDFEVYDEEEKTIDEILRDRKF